MYYSLYGCGDNLPQHICAPCASARHREFARTRIVGFVRQAYLETLVAALNYPSAWITGRNDGQIIVIPEAAGSFDPGDPKELKGYGDRKFSYGPRTMMLSIFDPDYKDNYPFYNEIGDATDLVPFFVTSSLLHLFDKPASIKAKNPVADDLEEEVVWNVECQVVSQNLPSIHDVEPIREALVCNPN